MGYFEIVAHRGITTDEPENTLPAFQRAVELGADAVELDVRLTSDHVPVIYHYYYLHLNTTGSGPIFDYSLAQLRQVRVRNKTNPDSLGEKIPTLSEVLEAVGGRIALEIEIKGPEPEAPRIVGDILCQNKHLWDTIEVTSYEPALLVSIQEHCPGLIADLLFPRSQDWMKPDVVGYEAIHRARLARARGVHLHPSQLSPEIVSSIRNYGFEVHAWDVKDEPALNTVLELKIPMISTDHFRQALHFRNEVTKGQATGVGATRP